MLKTAPALSTAFNQSTAAEGTWRHRRFHRRTLEQRPKLQRASDSRDQHPAVDLWVWHNSLLREEHNASSVASGNDRRPLWHVVTIRLAYG